MTGCKSYKSPFGAEYPWVIFDDYVSNNKEEETMSDKKHYRTYDSWSGVSSVFEKYEDAEAHAKRLATTPSKANGNFTGVTVYEAIATVRAPLPAAEVSKLV